MSFGVYSGLVRTAPRALMNMVGAGSAAALVPGSTLPQFAFPPAYTPQYFFNSFTVLSAEEKMHVICKMLDVLIEADVTYLRHFPNTPLLYDSGVVYKNEELGKDEWQDIPCSIQRRSGDCEDLASWRVAELRFRGENARHVVEHRKTDKLVLYHIKVLRGSNLVMPLAPGSKLDPATGRYVEDPSKLLGMKGVA